MQLQDLACEIFVEPALLPQAGDRVGTDGAGVVEIVQHRRMRFRREQHVAEAAEHGVEARLGLVEIDLLRHAGAGLRRLRLRRSGIGALLRGAWLRSAWWL